LRYSASKRINVQGIKSTANPPGLVVLIRGFGHVSIMVYCPGTVEKVSTGGGDFVVSLSPGILRRMPKLIRHRPPHHRGPRAGIVLRFLALSLLDLTRPVKRVTAPDPVIDPTKLQVWMVGHATMLINFYGTTILTDPVFGNWLPFPRRLVSAGLRIEQLPKIDLVLQSHVHWDHFHIPSVRRIAGPETTLIIAKNCRDLAAKMSWHDIVELDAGDIHEHDDIRISTYRPHHWGRRLPWERQQRGFNAYVIEKAGTSIFFNGDSGYGPVFQEVAKHHTIDLSLLPIGAYDPPSFRPVHMGPDDALQAMVDLKAKAMIPFHHGSFRLSREPMHEPAEKLRALATEHNIAGVNILHNGEYYEHRT
jgi:L-ascorbate metabolism protein UlaG (beta-lactamase superfamily)